MESRIHADLDTLTFDHERGMLRSRHSLRPETFLESLPFIARRARGESSHPDGVLDWRRPYLDIRTFRVKAANGQSYVLQNLIVYNSYSCCVPGRPKVIVCSHVDSDGFLSGGGWRFDRDPAPGADDAASGCAALLELIRQTGALRLPFDLEYHFYSGEEQGLLGSEHEAAESRARGDSILAVINLDQLAYVPRHDSLFVVADSLSAGLADSLASVAHRAWDGGPELVPRVLAARRNNSDHYPYQIRNIPAVMLAEAENPSMVNPTTETIADTLGNVSLRAVRRAVEVLSLWLRELSEPVFVAHPREWPESWDCRAQPRVIEGDSLRIPTTDIHVYAGRAFDETWYIKTHVEGTSANDVCGLSYSIRRTIDQAQETPSFAPGSALAFEGISKLLPASWIGKQFIGQHWIGAGGTRYSSYDDVWSTILQIARPSFQWDRGPIANPYRAGQYAVGVRLALDLGTRIQVELFDSSGRRRISRSVAAESSVGDVVLRLLEPAESRVMPAGVYFYRLTLSDGGTSQGRFMLLK